MNNSCKFIKNYDLEQSVYMYRKYVNELKKYSNLILVNFILENYNVMTIEKMLQEYDCLDVLETIQNVYNRIIQYKRVLEQIEGNLKMDKFTIQKCETIVKDILHGSNYTGGTPFRQFIRNLFRRDVDGQDVDIMYSFIFIIFLSTILSYVDRDLSRQAQLGFLLVPAFERILRARRMRNIPEREFNVLYELVFRNTDRHLEGRIIVSFNQYARYYIDGLDLLQWLPTFGNQMITRDFERDNLRRLSSELNLYNNLVQQIGWLNLGRDEDYNLNLDLAINAFRVQLRNRNIQQQREAEPIGEMDCVIIRRASELVHSMGSENCCSICFEDLIESDDENETRNKNGYLVKLHQQVMGVPHIFHLKCIKNWFSQAINDDCPLCRLNIRWSHQLASLNIPADENGIDFFDVELDL